MGATARLQTGRSAQFPDNGINFVFSFPGSLTTSDNGNIPRLAPEVPVTVKKCKVIVVTAPTGASLIVLFKKFTLSTGVVGSTIATVTVAAGAFQASTDCDVDVAITEGICAEISQVGSVVPGSTAAMIANAVPSA